MPASFPVARVHPSFSKLFTVFCRWVFATAENIVFRRIVVNELKAVARFEPFGIDVIGLIDAENANRP